MQNTVTIDVVRSALELIRLLNFSSISFLMTVSAESVSAYFTGESFSLGFGFLFSFPVGSTVFSGVVYASAFPSGTKR